MDGLQYFQDKIGIFDYTVNVVQSELYYSYLQRDSGTSDQAAVADVRKMRKSQKCQLFLDIALQYFRGNTFDSRSGLQEDRFQAGAKFFAQYSFLWVLFQIHSIDDVSEENRQMMRGFCALHGQLERTLADKSPLSQLIFNYEDSADYAPEIDLCYLLKQVRVRKARKNLPNSAYYQWFRKLIEHLKRDLEETVSDQSPPGSCHVLNLLDRCV